MSETRELLIEDIRRTYDLQPRVVMDQATVDEYAAAMANGDEFPPVLVFQEGTDYWLADGWHRVEAVIRWGQVVIMAEIHQGTKRDAIMWSTAANATHGLRRSNADKRKAVKTLLEDAEWGQWSDREIARRCRVSHPLVGKLRKTRDVIRDLAQYAEGQRESQTDGPAVADAPDPVVVYCGEIEAEPVSLPAQEVETLPPRGQSAWAATLAPKPAQVVTEANPTELDEELGEVGKEDDVTVALELTSTPGKVGNWLLTIFLHDLHSTPAAELAQLPIKLIVEEPTHRVQYLNTTLQELPRFTQRLIEHIAANIDADDESGNVTTDVPDDAVATETESGTAEEPTAEPEPVPTYEFGIGTFVRWGDLPDTCGEIMNWTVNGKVAFIRQHDGRGVQMPAFMLKEMAVCQS